MKLLIVEDDRNLSCALRECIAPRYDADQAFDGAEGLFLAERGVYDLIILDLMLPRMGGQDVLAALRAGGVSTPVLILTADGSLASKVRGLRAGADDYLAKPFDIDELLCRIEAILRRSRGVGDVRLLSFKGLVMDGARREARIDGREVELRGKQYDILEYLVGHSEELVTKNQLFDRVWGFMSDTSSNVVEVYVSALRKALAVHGYDGYLKTIRGAGYLLTEDAGE